MSASQKATREMTELWKDFTFEASHVLPRMPEGHQCRRVHGHSYKLRVVVAGNIGPDGCVANLDELDAEVRKLLATVDHYHLNDVPGLSNPTSEVIAFWFGHHLTMTVDKLARVEIQEAPSCGAIWRKG